jgi:hypothetical protein
MTTQLKTTLSDLVTMASEGNRHAVPTLRQVLDATTGRLDRQHVTNAIQKAERAFAKATEAAPTISPTVFEVPAETRTLWELVSRAAGSSY